jgi:flap endonuclease-1
LFYRTAKLLENGAEPVFVFDGKPPAFKKTTTEARSRIREEARKKWKEAVKRKDIEAVRRYSQQAARLTPDMVEESKRLLSFMGIPSIQAPSEAEAQAAFLVRNNQVWSAGSQDWDSLMFGAPRLVRNLTITGRRKVPRKEKYIEVKPELVELGRVLEELGISQDQLIILGILVGTDYNPGGIKGIGPKTALKLVKENKTLEGVMSRVRWEAETKPDEILQFFKNPPVEKAEIRSEKFRPEKVKELLCEEHSFSEERISSALERLEKSGAGKGQAKLESFFGK